MRPLERALYAHGSARSVANMTPGCTIFADSLTASPVVAAAVAMQPDEHDVVRPSWVYDCAERRVRLPFEPQYMLHMTAATRSAVSHAFDPWGDAYCVDASPASLRAVFQAIARNPGASWAPDKPNAQSSAALAHLPLALIQQVESRTGIQSHTATCALRNCVLYLDRWLVLGDPSTPELCSSLDVCAALVRFYGGVVSDRLDASVTHIVVADPASPRLPRIQLLRRELFGTAGSSQRLCIPVVFPSWVDRCIAEATHLPEQPFLVPLADL